MLYAIDLIGTFVFAISGAQTAIHKRFDIFGAVIIAFVTAVGGGTLRDILIGSHPVGWMGDLNYLYLILLAVPCCLFFRKYILQLRRTLFLFDTIGIGLFTILGVQKSIAFGIAPPIAVMMGVVSAVFGGVIRDTLCNEIPLIFRQEIYATACLAGAIMYLILKMWTGNIDVSTLVAIGLVITIRILAVRYHWNTPKPKT